MAAGAGPSILMWPGLLPQPSHLLMILVRLEPLVREARKV